MLSDMEKMWQNPPSVFRTAPFWSWNGLLNKKRLCRQIESMHNAGMGGFFMHSRYGLKTEYLGREWFDCVHSCVNKAKQLDMKAYLYDEDRWPSGWAGGIVADKNKEFRMQCLAAVKAGKWKQNSEKKLLGVFSIEFDKNGFMKAYRAAADNEKDSNKLVFYARHEILSERYNNSTYIDTMNGRAVDGFLKSTYDRYAKRCGKFFGSAVPAIFTDEPNFGNRHSGLIDDEYLSPWTKDLLKEFKKRWGYDIAPHLPELIFVSEKNSFSKVRYDYYRTIGELFIENFSKQIGTWCSKNNIKLTGHMLFEGSCFQQVRAVGVCMPHYTFMQWPGIDILTDQADELLTAKQCGSIAAQFGKERVLSESWGCTGWDWPMEGQKFISDWQFACGVNFICPHLTHYTLQGGAKRDYPASICDHSPWWPYYKTVQDYLARNSFMLTQGKPIRDILIIHPVESVWGLFNALKPKVSEFIDRDLKSIIYTLTAEHLDWDLGDESVMADNACLNGKDLCIGQMRYKLVIIPSLVTLRSSTVALLKKFISKGGQVLLIGSKPNRIDGKIDKRINNLIKSSKYSRFDGFLSTVKSLIDRRLSVVENNHEQKKIWSMLRDIDGGKMLFIQSHDRKAVRKLKVRVEGISEPVVFWDALSGKKKLINSRSVNGSVAFDFDVPPSGSAVITLGVKTECAEEKPVKYNIVNTWKFSGPFNIELTEPNTCPLDYCRYKFSGDAFSELMPTATAEQCIRARFGLGARSNAKQQPWYLVKAGLIDSKPRGSVEMLYTFNIANIPARCLLAMEMPQLFKIKINGKKAGKAKGWWLDEDFHTIDISPLLKKGANQILLDFNYHTDMELEDMYLVGDFGITVLNRNKPVAPDNFTLVRQPQKLKCGFWTGQGLDFYGGAVKYKISVVKPKNNQRLVIKLPDVSCTMAVVHTNGKSFILPWAPFTADITDALTAGSNKVIIEIIGGRRNILGPLHLQPLAWTGPEQFDPCHPDWTFEYHLSAHGITAPVIVETLEYV